MSEDLFCWDEKIKEAKEKGWFVTHHDEDMIRFEQVIEGYENRIMEYYKKYEQLYRYDPRSGVKCVMVGENDQDQR